MIKRNKFILIVLFLSAIVRLIGLGLYPRGLSLSEVKLFFLTPFLVKLPFFALGIISLYLFYLFLIKFTANKKVSLIATVILSLTPWHFELSRVYSLAMPFLTLFLLVLNARNFQKILIFLLSILGIVYFISIFSFSDKLRTKVDAQRLNVSLISPPIATEIFVNKLTVSFQEKLNTLSDGLDWGMYFFNGHPREKWGVEETQKFFAATLIFIIIGFFLADKKKIVLMIEIFCFFLLLSGIFGKYDQHLLLGTGIVFSYFASLAFLFLWEDKKRRPLLFILSIFYIFELIYYGNLYFKNLGESRFSPRREIYLDITEKVKELRKDNERVVVNSRLIDPEPFFRFYLKDNFLDGFEFREFNIWRENLKDGLFVDVLPDDPGPSEPLYKLATGEIDVIDILFSQKDQGKNQTVYLYRYQ